MNALAFVILAVMFGMYVLFDGYDLGAGIVYLFVGHDRSERGAVLESIGPYWNGNEVWLIAAGAALFAFFPLVYASSFSGFYLPLIIVLWLLMFRGIALELRDFFANDLWQQFFDVTFSVASALLVLLFGVAFGNVLRGVPLGGTHYFTGTFAFLLNPFAVGVGLLAVLALGLHGAARIAGHVAGEPAQRAARAVRALWPAVALLTIVITAATFAVHSPVANLAAMPWTAIAPLAMLAGLIAIVVFANRGDAPRMFGASNLYLAGMFASAAATLFPYLLPGFPDASTGLRIDSVPPTPQSFLTILVIAIAGLVVVGAYRTFVVRQISADNQVLKS
jgi:cytochrome bd ubiquinol oxidase subunit II